jgi:hypothetical protein
MDLLIDPHASLLDVINPTNFLKQLQQVQEELGENKSLIFQPRETNLRHLYKASTVAIKTRGEFILIILEIPVIESEKFEVSSKYTSLQVTQSLLITGE